jgi:hypothetical protein
MQGAARLLRIPPGPAEEPVMPSLPATQTVALPLPGEPRT